MKKTMIFQSFEKYESWYDTNEARENGEHDFLNNRVMIVKGTKSVENKKYNGFSADAFIECKSRKTAVNRFVKALNEAGYTEINADWFESNIHDMEGSGMVIEVEEPSEGVYYVNFMMYQDEVIEAETEVKTTDRPKKLMEVNIMKKYYNVEIPRGEGAENFKKFLKLNNFYYEASGYYNLIHMEILATPSDLPSINNALDTMVWNA